MSPDRPSRVKTIRLIFLVQMIAGLAMIGMGLFIVPTIPYAMLDVVLSQPELLDDAKRDATLSLLQRPNSFYMFCWITAGAFVAVTSLVGRQVMQEVSSK